MRAIVRKLAAVAFCAAWAEWGFAEPAENEVRKTAEAIERDDAALAPFYTGDVFPTPQQATYSDSFASLSKVGIVAGEGVKPDDPRIGLLADRIRRYGGEATVVESFSGAYPTFVCVGAAEVGRELFKGRVVPDKPEGYLIAWGKQEGRDVIALQGRDRLGLLWAVVSFNQLVTIKDGRPLVRLAEVFDYPAVAKRGGVISLSDPLHINALLWAKINVVDAANAFTYRTPPLRDKPNLWRKELPERGKANVKMIGERLTPLGIEWYAQLNPLAFDETINQPRCKNEEDFQAILKHALFAAEQGGGLGLHFDDARFPIHPDDERDFGSAREADIYLLNRLYKEIKAKFPAAKLLFCPPFYWGPDGSHAYHESREEYLKAMGERVPKDVGIYWTGPRVKSNVIDREKHTRWMTALIQRKPWFWQNILYDHAYGYHYDTDPITKWGDWHYDGFFDDMEAYLLNVGGQARLPMATLADYLWNPKGYDPKRSIEAVTKRFFGPETWPALATVNEKLSFFDPYGSRLSPAAARDLPAMEQRMLEVDAAWSNAQAFHPGALKLFSQMGWAIQLQKNFVNGLKNNKELAGFAKNVEPEQKRAADEAGLNDKTDTFLSAYDFLGGYPAQPYAARCEKRLATWIYGARSPRPMMQARFEIEPFPPEREYRLILSAQDDELETECGIKIQVNETAIFEGKSGFARNGWSRRTFTIPAAALKRSNELKIFNIEDSDANAGPPFFMLNYAIVRKVTEPDK